MSVKEKEKTDILISVENGEIVCESVTHTKKDKKVQWECRTNRWKVAFDDDSPFKKKEFSGKAGKRDGEKVKKDAKLNHAYKYTVSVEINNAWKDLDPELIIDA